MPTLNKNYSLTITPEQFLEACSRTELIELEMLLNSNRFSTVIDNHNSDDYLKLNFIPGNRVDDFEKENFNSGV